MNVLIVDDMMIMRETLKRIVLKLGHVVVGEGENGKEAIELYKKLQPDLVTLDMVMPEMTGIEALKEIITFDPKAKAIMVSASNWKSLALETLDAGALDYIVKPFEEYRVKASIDRLFSDMSAPQKE